MEEVTEDWELQQLLTDGNASVQLVVEPQSDIEGLCGVLRAFHTSSVCKKFSLVFGEGNWRTIRTKTLLTLMEAIGSLPSISSFEVDFEFTAVRNSVSLLTCVLRPLASRLESLALKHIYLHADDEIENMEEFLEVIMLLRRLERLQLHCIGFDGCVDDFDEVPIETAVVDLPNIREVYLALDRYKLELCEILLAKHSMENLTISFETLDDDHAKALRHGLLYKNGTLNPHLRTLHLRIAEANSNAAAWFSDFVSTVLPLANTLETFILECLFPIDSDMLLPFASALPRLSLSRLHFKTNHGYQKLQQVVEACSASIKNNYTLVQLSFESFHRTPDCPFCHAETNQEHLGHDIDFYLKLNRLGRKKVMPNIENASLSQMIEVLAAVKWDTRCLYYYLRLKPDLCSLRRTGTPTPNLNHATVVGGDNTAMAGMASRSGTVAGMKRSLSPSRVEVVVDDAKMKKLQRLCDEKDEEIRRLRAALSESAAEKKEQK